LPIRGSWLLAPAVIAAAAAGGGVFREVPPAESRLYWTHNNARSAQRYLPETLPPGVGVLDFDNDGWMDILVVNSGESVFFRPQAPLTHALYRNNHDGTFTDVTRQAGLTQNFFAMGVAVGDYDGDGYPDLYLTGFGRSYLLHNTRNGAFADVTEKARVQVPGWSTSALWFDYDNDGRLDLFVPQFVDYSSLKTCSAADAYGGGAAETAPGPAADTFYCIPRIFNPTPSRLFRNNGDGTFSDVSRLTGIAFSAGKGLGAVATDVNNDGFLDLFQANDTVANFLFINRGGKNFEERAIEAGVAYSLDGQARSGMGVDSADVDGDGRQDLFVANVDQETFSLYHNDGDELFSDISHTAGVAKATRLLSGWGLRFFDYDNDGWPDLILANGHPDDKIELRRGSVTFAEPLLLFRNNGAGKLTNVTAMAGEAFQKRFAARGLAVGDLNNDGYPDVVVGVNGGPPLLLINTAGAGNAWVGLRLRGRRANPDAIGAIVRWSCGGKVRSRLVTAGGSYLSSHDPRLVLGLGRSGLPEWVEVRWPAPSRQTLRFRPAAVNRYIDVVEGEDPR
jgi:hypothetical protein